MPRKILGLERNLWVWITIMLFFALLVGLDQLIRFGVFFEVDQYHHEDIMAFFILLAALPVMLLIVQRLFPRERVARR